MFFCFSFSLNSIACLYICLKLLGHSPMENQSCNERGRKMGLKVNSSFQTILSESRSFTRDGKIDRILCPFSGRFHFTYDVNDGTENVVECPDSKSTISNCPKGSELDLRYFNMLTFSQFDLCYNNILLSTFFRCDTKYPGRFITFIFFLNQSRPFF